MPREESAQHHASHFYLFIVPSGRRLSFTALTLNVTRNRPWLPIHSWLLYCHSTARDCVCVSVSVCIRAYLCKCMCVCVCVVWLGGRNAYFNRLLWHEVRLHLVNFYIAHLVENVFCLIYPKKCKNEYDAIGLSPSEVNGLPLCYTEKHLWESFQLYFIIIA